ncbi:E3 ubiquitin-protein ligase HACE1-like isoform X2 [Babylonia areolata]|uniref:E3 ubiquitin-protein ligase HACE1-like isoform X2 n=1 Tax=Babylonia areolata TaxID=304850 RepID=UPI003FD3722A
MMAFLQKLAASLKRGRAAELPRDDKEAFYILMPMVIGNQHRSLADLLSSSKFPVSFQCGRAQRSLLHIAANCGNYDCLCLLLRKGAEINLQDRSGCTPLHLAAKNGQRKCLNKLLEHECDINLRNNEGLTAVHWLAVNGRTELLQDMLSRIRDVNIEDAQGQTPLHVACQNGHLQTLLCLVDNGANVNKPNNSGWTPLHFACKHGQHEAVEILLKRGAELRSEAGGRTPLALCLEEGYGETCEVLLKQWPKLFDYLVRSVCDVTISEENVLKVLKHLCHQDFRLKEKILDRLAEHVSIIGHHLLSDASQGKETTDSLIRAVRVLLSVEKIQRSSRRSESQDVLDMTVDHSHHSPVFERPCLLTLWQLLDDWMLLLDNDNNNPKTQAATEISQTNNDPGNLCLSPPCNGTAPAVETVASDIDPIPMKETWKDVIKDSPPAASLEKVGKAPVKEDGGVVPSCGASPDKETVVTPSASTGGSDGVQQQQQQQSPAIPQICALIQAFYLCTQTSSSEHNSKSSSKFFSFLRRHITTMRKFVESDPQLIFNHFHFLLSCPDYMADFLSIIHGQPFESRRGWFYENLPSPSQWNTASAAAEEDSQTTVKINREQLFRTSCEEVLLRPPDQLKYTLSVQFSGEEGLGQGLVREWFDLLSREILNPDYALFTMSADGCTFQPNSNSSINPDHLSYFRFAGRLLGLALFHRHLLSTYFTRSFYKHILGVPVNYQDVASIDPEYAKSLQWLLDHDISDLGLDLTFSIETDVFGSMQEVELLPGGSKMAVTEQNKAEYVQLVTELRMTRAIKPQIDSFLSGFHDYIPFSLVQLFNEYELELLLSGMPEINLNDWRANTNYTGYSADTPVIRWFWDFVESMTEQQRVQLLQFVTGSSRVPFGGFSQLSSGGSTQLFTISRQPCPQHPSIPLPTASTCINLLRLPEYPSPAVLEDRLLTALRCGSQGYGMV